jgi:CTD small phosphatase-like protein 2
MKKKASSPQDQLKNHPFRHLIFGPHIEDDIFKKYLQLTQRGLIYAKKCLKGPSD